MSVSRVLMTADGVGGVWTYALELVRAVPDVEVTVLVTGQRLTAAQEADAAALPNLTVVQRDLALEWMTDPGPDLDETDAVLRTLEAEFRPDVVHVNGYANAAAGFRAPAVIVAHSCVPTWWRACRGEAAPAEWDAYRTRLRAGVAAATLVVAPTEAHLGAFCAEHGRPRLTRVVLNGRDPGLFAASPKRPFALAAGRLWDEGKNIAVLDEAARALHHPVVVAGETGAAAFPRLFALGPLDPAALRAKMAEAAVFVAPARYEPFGMAVLEAALSGCALVLSDIPTFRELWEGAARFVPADDAPAIGAALDELLSDPVRAERAGLAARRRAARYTAEAMARGMRRVWADAVAAHGARRTTGGRVAA